ncbi:hypothetical protein ETB97_007326 [Aspergillus alliaceus]|uniref:Uncharacterized protein n=1 Tax=Petromyces alliaceus TaxID=209559 RepID=A0A8H5ZWB9_PETAA|nr:hypothetical protein ETB97_007326 [Aspergillus burnettii]
MRLWVFVSSWGKGPMNPLVLRVGEWKIDQHASMITIQPRLLHSTPSRVLNSRHSHPLWGNPTSKRKFSDNGIAGFSLLIRVYLRCSFGRLSRLSLGLVEAQWLPAEKRGDAPRGAAWHSEASLGKRCHGQRKA